MYRQGKSSSFNGLCTIHMFVNDKNTTDSYLIAYSVHSQAIHPNQWKQARQKHVWRGCLTHFPNTVHALRIIWASMNTPYTNELTLEMQTKDKLKMLFVRHWYTDRPVTNLKQFGSPQSVSVFSNSFAAGHNHKRQNVMDTSVLWWINIKLYALCEYEQIKFYSIVSTRLGQKAMEVLENGN